MRSESSPANNRHTYLSQFMSTLKVENLSKQYGDVTALKDVSFEIEDEFVVLLGESGAGRRCFAV